MLTLEAGTAFAVETDGITDLEAAMLRSTTILFIILLLGAGCGEDKHLLSLGELCSKSSQCAGDLVCATIIDHRECREPWGLEGMGCQDRGYCQPEFSCVEKNDFTCMVTRQEEEQCHWNAECDGALVCNWGHEPHICTPLGEEGDICGYENECAGGLQCNLEIGECRYTCSYNSDCPAGYQCVEKAGNECRPVRLEGETCHWNDECEGALICNWGYEPDVCTPVSGWGDICGHFNECTEGLYCLTELTPGVCAGACQQDQDCPQGTLCVPDAEPPCRAPKYLDEPCSTQKECQGDLVCNMGVWPFRCLHPSQTGAACMMDEECAEGLLCIPNPDTEQDYFLAPTFCAPPQAAGGDCLTDDHCLPDLTCQPPDPSAYGHCSSGQ